MLIVMLVQMILTIQNFLLPYQSSFYPLPTPKSIMVKMDEKNTVTKKVPINWELTWLSVFTCECS